LKEENRYKQRKAKEKAEEEKDKQAREGQESRLRSK
jgi:hypothetical protein